MLEVCLDFMNCIRAGETYSWENASILPFEVFIHEAYWFISRLLSQAKPSDPALTVAVSGRHLCA